MGAEEKRQKKGGRKKVEKKKRETKICLRAKNLLEPREVHRTETGKWGKGRGAEGPFEGAG